MHSQTPPPPPFLFYASLARYHCAFAARGYMGGRRGGSVVAVLDRIPATRDAKSRLLLGVWTSMQDLESQGPKNKWAIQPPCFARDSATSILCKLHLWLPARRGSSNRFRTEVAVAEQSLHLDHARYCEMQVSSKFQGEEVVQKISAHTPRRARMPRAARANTRCRACCRAWWWLDIRSHTHPRRRRKSAASAQ